MAWIWKFPDAENVELVLGSGAAGGLSQAMIALKILLERAES